MVTLPTFSNCSYYRFNLLTGGTSNTDVGVEFRTIPPSLDVLGNSVLNGSIGVNNSNHQHMLDVNGDVEIGQNYTYGPTYPYGFTTTNIRYALLCTVHNNSGLFSKDSWAAMTRHNWHKDTTDLNWN